MLLIIMINNILWLLSDHRVYVSLNILSEVLGMFRMYPVAYALKVCVDMPKEYMKVLLISK